MLRITLIIPDEQVAFIQRNGFELDARKRIVEEIIMTNSTNPAVLEGETFKKYHEKYQESSVAFEIAKAELEKAHVPAELKTGDGLTNWELDYSNCEMNITYSGNKFDTCPDVLNFGVPADCVTIEVVDTLAPKQCGCGGSCQ